MADIETLVQSFIDLLDVLVELYLGSFIKPFLLLHVHVHTDEVYANFNAFIRGFFDDNKKYVPEWLTANFIAYARAVLLIPTIMLLAGGQLVLPALLIILVHFAGFLDGVVARFWVDAKRDRAEDAVRDDDRPTSKAPSDGDDNDSLDSYEFEVVTTGSPQRMKSWNVNHRNRTYDGFVDTICDKAFVIPCWIYLLSTVPTSAQFRSIQYGCLWWLIVSETTSGCLRFKTFFAAGGVPAPQLEGIDFSSSAVKSAQINAVKQTFQMLGTALFVLPYLRYLGVLLLALACPLAYESIRRKSKKRVLYVIYVCTTKSDKFDYKTIKFWTQVKAMGASKLIVGVIGENQTDMVCNACSTACVDEVIAEAPAKADLMFLERQRLDYVVFLSGQSGLVTDEVIAAGVCMVIGDDNVARLLRPKEESKRA